MRKTLSLFLLLFIIASCSGEDTPTDDKNNNNGGGGNTVADPFYYEFYPEKLTFKNPSLFVKDKKIQGYLPYPVMTGTTPSTMDEEYTFYFEGDLNNSENINVNKTRVLLNTTSIKDQPYNVNLFDGKEANITDNDMVTRHDTKNDFIFQYKVSSVKDKKQAIISYKQTGVSTWEKSEMLYVNENWTPTISKEEL